mgnify:CR=1 FL=1
MASPPGNTTSYGKQEQTLEQRMDPKLYALRNFLYLNGHYE